VLALCHLSTCNNYTTTWRHLSPRSGKYSALHQASPKLLWPNCPLSERRIISKFGFNTKPNQYLHVFLIEKDTCTVVKNIALHLEKKLGHVPKSVANAFADVWKQILVIRVVPWFLLLVVDVGQATYVGYSTVYDDVRSSRSWSCVDDSWTTLVCAALWIKHPDVQSSDRTELSVFFRVKEAAEYADWEAVPNHTWVKGMCASKMSLVWMPECQQAYVDQL